MKLSLKIVQPLVVFGALAVSSLLSGCRAASLTIAENGKSAYSIVVPAVAAQSVNDAAAEMQLDIAEATGAKLPIVKDSQPITGPFISLGSTQPAQAANITVDKIPAEGFRIVTRNGNLFIIGLDTTTVDLNREKGNVNSRTPKDELHPQIPGPAFTENGGYSRGTANGVYTFLENQLGVRWLMPGDIGRDVPARKVFQVEEMDRTQAPEFIYRKILDLGGGEAVARWRDHQRLGFSFRLHHRHSWQEVVPLSMYDQHPDWFAMDSSGHRPKPRRTTYKLETTNPEVIEYFAEQAVETLKATPQFNTFSLSPTDSGGWSQSPQSKLFMDPPPPGQYGQDVTRLVLKWYSDVSAAVAKKYPQGKLAGLIYGDYRYAPETGDVKLPDNFTPMFVHGGNQYSMYRPAVSEATTAFIGSWSKYLPKTWFYYTHPLWLREWYTVGLVTPAAPETLNAMFAPLVKYHSSGVMFYGNPGWSDAALKSYITAQLLWNPRADAKEIQHDWLMRAYGPQAGPIMEEFYNKMDESWFSDAFRSGVGRGTVDEPMMRTIYGAHYPQMEELLVKAWNQPMTAKQKERLGLIRDNMRVLQWRLKNAEYLPADYTSPLTINAQQVFQVVTAKHKDFTHFGKIPSADGARHIKDVKVQLASQATQKTGAKSPSVPNSNLMLLFPTRDGEVTIRPREVHPGSSILVYFVQDGKGRLIDKGILSEEQEIVFKAQANEPYYFSHIAYGTSNPELKYQLSIPQSIAVSRATFHDGVVNLYPDETGSAPLYVYVPEKLPWQMKTEGSGVVVQTQTAHASEMSDKDRARAAERAADKALKLALTRYQAGVVTDLNRWWHFKTDPQKTGEEQGFEKAGFDDDSWKVIPAVGTWQSHGFDYHGTAWYRKTFNPFKKGDEVYELAGRKMLLFFGAVDGDAVFYLNGQKIGEHKMLDPNTDWQVPIVFDVTRVIHANSDNTIAVKVTKDRLASGIYKGVSLLVGTLPEK